MITLKCIGSGSSGNCYLLENETECLILDCGIPIKEIKKALDFNVSKIVGVVVTHSHKDHSLSVNEFEKMGIKVHKPYELVTGRFQIDDYDPRYKCGNFSIKAFPCVHNVPCFGFYVTHPDFGKLIYATDTCYIKYKFRDLNHILVECNYQKDMVDVQEYKYEHELKDHMERSTCIDFIKANATDSLQNVILCHLSQSAIDDVETLELVKKEVKSSVYIATKGLEIELVNKDVCPFM